MDDEPESKGKIRNRGSQPRLWTQRFEEPLRFARFTDRDGRGQMKIMYKFALPPTETELPDEVYSVLCETKYLDRAEGHGSGRIRTGLEFNRHPKHGPVWSLPNNERGRFAADILDSRLLALAHKIEQEGPDL